METQSLSKVIKHKIFVVFGKSELINLLVKCDLIISKETPSYQNLLIF